MSDPEEIEQAITEAFEEMEVFGALGPGLRPKGRGRPQEAAPSGSQR